MSTKGNRENNLTALDKLINEITVDAYGDDEVLWAFRQVFEDDVNFPADGFVNQGVRFLIDDVKTRTAWEEREVK